MNRTLSIIVYSYLTLETPKIIKLNLQNVFFTDIFTFKEFTLLGSLIAAKLCLSSFASTPTIDISVT